MTKSAASLSDNLTALLIPRVCSIAVAMMAISQQAAECVLLAHTGRSHIRLVCLLLIATLDSPTSEQISTVLMSNRDRTQGDSTQKLVVTSSTAVNLHPTQL